MPLNSPEKKIQIAVVRAPIHCYAAEDLGLNYEGTINPEHSKGSF